MLSEGQGTSATLLNLYQDKGLGRKCGEKPRDHKFLEPEEFSHLLSTVRYSVHPLSQLAYDLFWFMGNFGLRISETLDLTFGDFRNLHFNRFTVRRRKKRKKLGATEARKERRKWIGVVLTEDIRLAPEEAERLTLFIERRRSLVRGERLFPISKRTAQYLFTGFARASGLLALKPRLSIHALRHTCGVLLYEATGDLRFVQERLGHESLRTCEIYVHLSSKRRLELGSKRVFVD